MATSVQDRAFRAHQGLGLAIAGVQHVLVRRR
jgi:hypothetical protein